MATQLLLHQIKADIDTIDKNIAKINERFFEVVDTGIPGLEAAVNTVVIDPVVSGASEKSRGRSCQDDSLPPQYKRRSRSWFCKR